MKSLLTLTPCVSWDDPWLQHCKALRTWWESLHPSTTLFLTSHECILLFLYRALQSPPECAGELKHCMGFFLSALRKTLLASKQHASDHDAAILDSLLQKFGSFESLSQKLLQLDNSKPWKAFQRLWGTPVAVSPYMLVTKRCVPGSKVCPVKISPLHADIDSSCGIDYNGTHWIHLESMDEHEQMKFEENVYTPITEVLCDAPYEWLDSLPLHHIERLDFDVPTPTEPIIRCSEESKKYHILFTELRNCKAVESSIYSSKESDELLHLMSTNDEWKQVLYTHIVDKQDATGFREHSLQDPTLACFLLQKLTNTPYYLVVFDSVIKDVDVLVFGEPSRRHVSIFSHKVFGYCGGKTYIFQHHTM